MPSLPIPLISALVLAFFLVRLVAMDRRNGPLAVLLALCAVQGLIISLAQHYGLSFARTLQPVTASLIPPMAWVAFQTTAVRRLAGVDGVHLFGPCLVVVAVLGLPQVLDGLIPALFVGYGIALIFHARKGADALPRMRLAEADVPGLIWQIVGWSLVASALSDGLIVAVQMAGFRHFQPWIISISASTTLILIGVLSVSDALRSSDAEPDESPAPRAADALDAQIMSQLETYMVASRPYLNPDLTMSHLSRRMRIPVKQLSGAINRVTGENVSRYINSARIVAAQCALLKGQSVTVAMLDAGFNTKSNFNREFLRVTGQSPSDWLEAQQR